jgi:DNA-binding response OmpR family regulator
MHWLTRPDAEVPDLVLLDVGLPELDGFEVARRLKTRPQLAHTVFVMLSRRDGVLDKMKGRLAGAQDYITKPFKTENLVCLVQSRLGLPTAREQALTRGKNG